MPTFTLQHRHAELDAHNQRTTTRIEAETHIDNRTHAGATAGGDQRKLRGIPAIARGVTGAIPGTSPQFA
jgi:hypothetical protein